MAEGITAAIMPFSLAKSRLWWFWVAKMQKNLRFWVAKMQKILRFWVAKMQNQVDFLEGACYIL